MNFLEEADWWFNVVTNDVSQQWSLIESVSWFMVSACCSHVATSIGSGGHREQPAKERKDATLSLDSSKDLKENKWELNFP